ncbi:MAG TPA: lipoprotein LpqH [Mycobacterium sp.]|nr:lipoprotein LpqH [Mycobacterium sp.]
MQNRFVVVTVAALCAVAGIAGCSSTPANSPQPPGALPPGTAEVTVNGQSAGTTRAVQCTQDSWTHTIMTGDNKSGAKVVVETGKSINATSVVITNISDFTGTVLENNIGKAEASMIGTTFRVTGTAQGSTTQNPNQVSTANFEVKANC